jgi:hypothetical protein
MTALAGSKYSIGYVVDALLSASFTMYMGRHALIGLNKVSCVASRGIDAALKFCYFDVNRADSYAKTVASWVPERISNFFKDDSGYNLTHMENKDVQAKDQDGKLVFEVDGKTAKMVNKKVEVYNNSTVTLLTSGIAMSLFALVALELKEALWRPAHPLLNGVLSYISPVRLVLGQSWVADGINSVVDAAKSRI